MSRNQSLVSLVAGPDSERERECARVAVGEIAYRIIRECGECPGWWSGGCCG